VRAKDGPVVIVIPAHNEEAVLPLMLEELRESANRAECHVVVGVNASTDRTGAMAREAGVLVAETGLRGYGHGCASAIRLAEQEWPETGAWLFMAADGANDPAEISRLVAVYREGRGLFVLGSRTQYPVNREVMGGMHLMVNRWLGIWCGCLSGHFFSDLGPFRLIDASLYRAMEMREMTYGYTAESQVMAPWLTDALEEIPVRERPRLAGRQKISGVNLKKTLEVGSRILAAAFRTRLRRGRACRRPSIDSMIPT